MWLKLTGGQAIILTCLYFAVAPGAAAQEPGRIYGRVTDWQGKPLANCEVILEHWSWYQYRIVFTQVKRTSSDGGYVFDQLPRGPYVLRFRVPKRSEETESVFLGVLVAGPPGPESPEDLNKEVSVSIGPAPEPTPLASPRPTSSPTPRPSPRQTPTSTPLAFPTVTPNVSPTPVPQSKIDSLLARLEFGNIVFNMPPAMVLNKVESISLLLSKKHTVQELQEKIREEAVAGDIEDSRIKVHDKMQAIITGDGFQITAVTADTLPISQQEVTEWKWDVRPLRSGKLRLHVVLNAVVDLDDGTGPHPFPIRTFNKEYVVDVPWRDRSFFSFISNNWQWLWTTLIIPVAAWVWSRKRKKNKAGFV